MSVLEPDRDRRSVTELEQTGCNESVERLQSAKDLHHTFGPNTCLDLYHMGKSAAGYKNSLSTQFRNERMCRNQQRTLFLIQEDLHFREGPRQDPFLLVDRCCPKPQRTRARVDLGLNCIDVTGELFPQALY